MATALLAAFDDYIRAQAVLIAPTEGEFSKYVDYQERTFNRVSHLKDLNAKLKEENSKLKAENDTKDIKLKHVRNSFDAEVKKRMEVEDLLRQYESQFEMIKEVLSSKDRMKMLNDEERQSLFNFGDNNSLISAGNSYSVALSPSEVSVDPLDEDEEISMLRNKKRWKRRRTKSNDQQLEDEFPPSKRLSKEKQEVCPPTVKEKHMTLSRPPPSKGRRKPSKDFLKKSFSEANLSEMNNSEEDNVKKPLDEVELDDQPLSAPTSPSAPPLQPDGLYPNLEDVVGSPSACSPRKSPGCVSTYSGVSEHMKMKLHSFVIKKVIKPESCHVCNRRIGFGKSAHKCKDCRAVCHANCKLNLPTPCVPTVPTPKRARYDGDLASYCPAATPKVPALVIHCAREVEKRGLNEVGIYRVPGSEAKVKEVKEKLLKGKGYPNLSKIDDIHVICSVLKDFLRNLKEPLLTYTLHGAFTLAADMENDEEALAQCLQAIAQLPTANKDTLAFIILHIKTVAYHSKENKMTLESLAKVFGPTVVGHSSAEPEAAVIWHDTQKQPKVMMRLLNISNEYWEEYVNPSEQFELIRSPDFTVKSPTPLNLGSPVTPEVTPVPESPFFGPCTSPRRHQARVHFSTNNAVPAYGQKVKRNGPFFAPLD